MYVFRSGAARSAVNEVIVAGASVIALHSNFEHESDVAFLSDAVNYAMAARSHGCRHITAKSSELADKDVERLRHMVGKC